MRSTWWGAMVTVGLGLGTGCGATPSPPVEPPKAPVVDTVSPEPTTTPPGLRELPQGVPSFEVSRDRVMVDGQVIAELKPVDEVGQRTTINRVVEHATRLRDASPRAGVTFTDDTPGHLVGSLVLSLAQAGFTELLLKVGPSYRALAVDPTDIKDQPRLRLGFDDGGWLLNLYEEGKAGPVDRQRGVHPTDLHRATTQALEKDAEGPIYVHVDDELSWGEQAPALGAFQEAQHEQRDERVLLSRFPMPGFLEAPRIQTVVRNAFDKFRTCYEDALREDPTVEGRVVVRFVIARDGTTPNVTATVDNSLPKPVGDCVAKEFHQLQFPKPIGGIVTVSYPIVFTPGKP